EISKVFVAAAQTFEVSETSKVFVAAASATVRVGGTSAYTVVPGGQVTVPVEVVNAVNLGSATVLLTYDPAVARAVGCARPAGSQFDGGVCNTGYAQGVVKFNAVASQGVTGTLRFYDIVLQAVSSASAQTALSLTIESFTDAQGRALTASIQNGSLAVIGSAAPAVVIRAGTPVQGSFVLTAGLSLDVPVSLQVTGTQQLAAATLILAYDPAVLRPIRCTASQPPIGSGYCNPTFAAETGLIKLNLLSEAGLSGDLRPYTVTFEAASGVNTGRSDLLPIVEYLADPNGALLTWQVVTGTVQVVAGAGPVAQIQVGEASAAFTATHGLTTTVPIWVDGVAGLAAATFALGYDSTVVRALSCAIPQGIDGGVCAPYDGRIQASLIASQRITGAGRLLDVVFTSAAGALPGASSPLTLTVRNLMDAQAGPIPARVRSGVITVTEGGSLDAVALVRVGDGANGGSFTLPIGEQVKVTLTVVGASNLAAAAVALGYDPAVARPLTCTPGAAFGGGACNPAAADGLIRFNVVATAAFSGTAALGSVTFQATDGAAAGAATPLTLTVSYFGGPAGEPLLYQVAAGSLALVAPAGYVPQVRLAAGEGLYRIGIGGLVTVPITASVAATTTAAGLGVATLGLAYDPAVVQPLACQLDVEAGFCNLAFGPGQIKLNALSTTGLTGATPLARVIFRGLGSGGATPITHTTPLTLTVETLADPAMQNLTYARQAATIQVGGTDDDGDRVGSEVENGAADGGDGNNDGIPDATQSNVTSLPNAVSGGYVTLAAPAGTTLTDVYVAPNPAPSDTPAGAFFPVGFLAFTAQDVPIGGALSLTIFLPPTAPAAEFYEKYGPTPDGQPAHWYRFDYDGTTGAEIQSDRIRLYFVDGGRGDADLTANGVIVDPGAPGLDALAKGPPLVVGDFYHAIQTGALAVAPTAGVLLNDRDVAGLPLRVSLGTPPGHGALSLGGDGSLIYAPASGFAGVDTFAYRASNGFLDASATVTFTVLPIADGAAGVAAPTGDLTLVYTDAHHNPTTVFIPANAVAQRTSLIYAAKVSPSAAPPGGLLFANKVFTLDAYVDGQHQAGFGFTRPLTVTLTYADSDVAAVKEAELVIYHWTGAAWDDAATTCAPMSKYQRDLTGNRLAVAICHLTEFGLFGPSSPLGVGLESFDATPALGAVRVTWETVSELDNLGFNLYRAVAGIGSQPAGGAWARLNATLIPSAAPGSSTGHFYEWLDADVSREGDYYYRLEGVDLGGNPVFLGVTHVTVHTYLPATTASLTAGALCLRWEHTIAAVTSYQIWRSSRPYFTPGDPDATPFKALAAVSGAMVWCDPQGAADPLTPYFYRVRSLGVGGQVVGFSQVTGRFNYAVQ
ncbi:MAG: cohesin domain-containing protein, partial [Chloroflexi bacterium]|nr:cohesin domain-containing protein [Chloroflexota bacterium]